ncbi:MAG TPA: hydantoinase/oxoprolinase family protein [Urbifossiella sp.]|jgi:hypothetical protein
MTPIVLGLDIGGANLKAATADKRAVSVPFALWKQPDRLPAALADLADQFPDATEFAVTMTGELCDCFETKRQGVNAILDAVEFAAKGRFVRVWSTDGKFIDVEQSRRDHLKVAAANWHALATFAGRYAPEGGGLLIDIGSTTTDIIPLNDGFPRTRGLTDWKRLETNELVYIGMTRTPVCALSTVDTCAELFATTHDINIVLGLLPEQPGNCDSADGRPLTREYSLARLARMMGGDRDVLTDDAIHHFAECVVNTIVGRVAQSVWEAYFEKKDRPNLRVLITSGMGEFQIDAIMSRLSHCMNLERVVSLNEILGPTVSACAPAYALAILATECQS